VTPAYNKIHLRFKLNGINYAHEELKEVAYSLVKEGDPYEKIVGDFLMDWLDGNDYVYVKTSGSTGEQKVIQLKKQAMANSAIATGDFFKLGPGDSALHCLPAQYIAGKMMFIRALILGLELDLIEPSAHPIFDPYKAYDFCAMIPLQLQNSIANINNIKTIIVGGAKVSDQLINNLQQCSAHVYETFGMTETITHVATKLLNVNREKYYNALPHISISKDDRDCLVIVATNISEDKIVTNDIVKLHSDTSFEWLGRIDNVINSGGVKLYPEIIEEKLKNKIERRFFITSHPDIKLGEKLILVVEGEDATIDSHSFDGLDTYEIPKQIFTVHKFEETPTGKIKRVETLKMIKQ